MDSKVPMPAVHNLVCLFVPHAVQPLVLFNCEHGKDKASVVHL